MYPVTIAYQIKQFPEESYQRYSRRYWFVAKQNPKTRTEFLQAVKWSIIDASIAYDHTKYSQEVMDLVTRMRIK